MAKHENDPGTIDFLSNEANAIIKQEKKRMSETEKKQARREYLRQKKAESRLRLRKAASTAAAFRTGERAKMTAQVTLTITYGARAILEELAKEADISMSGIVEELIQKHRKARAMKAKMPGLFPNG